jgi:2-keto-4-pentenoate hydratase/2-oxohepta-3-ene-1,7-dioic acid hydratase in catechol pathway
MSPWIVTGLNPDDPRVTIRLNGREMFTYAVKDAIFGVRQFVSRMSQYLTLHPGDVLWMGTDGAPENTTRSCESAGPGYPRKSSQVSSHAWVVSASDATSIRSSLPWKRPAIASAVSARENRPKP